MNQIIPDEALLDQFEAYHSGRMNTEDQNRFANRLATEPGFNESYHGFLTSREAIEIKISDDLKAKMKKWQKQSLPGGLSEAGRIRRLPWSAWAAAAALLFLLTFGFIQYRSVQSYPLDAIDEYQPVQALTLRNGDQDSGLNGIIRDYTSEAATLDQTISALLKIRPETPGNEYQKAQSYLAKLYLRQGLCADAAAAYLRSGELEGARDEAEIGAVLCLIREGHTREEINGALKPILDHPNHSYALAAREIDQKINGFWWRLFK
ncbi:MAG TPA: hypothetical protein PKM27_11410 [Saprospiraceae bacterium]|nr:hypothetical protein [Saprospiraceae bacterium]HNT20317.1 hypothetical protein [Saprospiraceae bacterium]